MAASMNRFLHHNTPRLKQKKESRLKFVTDSDAERIEEGLSIQLPATGKLRIGSSTRAHIRIPELSPCVAYLELKPRQTFLHPNPVLFKHIEVNGERLSSKKSISLKHNYVITFYSQHELAIYEQKFFRFVYYNRFLDPQA